MALIRLDKFISERTEYSRSNIKEFAKKVSFMSTALLKKLPTEK